VLKPLEASLSGNANRKKPTMTPQQLWASVQAGNTNAAVALAELYIKGEGVPQNCNQARVLLLVASEKKNPEAIKRLQELNKTDCP
jgi:TPR repeat protein